ncbi:sorting nexin-8-like [Tachypleus tridentatus]|uniref:sorting nexin-8-like n=1 Tax=Tachypleus tridentatus TaxID=6853 RepID=UPI003FD59843
MAADLNFGSVPPMYRQIYDILCPGSETRIDQEIFIKLLVKSSLPIQTLTQIWEIADSGQGYLNRIGLYKALALTGFAQQGKTVSDKILQNFAGEELPKPSLGDLADLRATSIRLRRERNPTRLGMTFEEICALETVEVTVVPEKKGLFLKHVEYEVTSQKFKSVVQRRYNDFVSFHEMLLQKFPFRAVPQLPPKKIMGADSQFIEDRRKGLKRFVTLITRHPVISDDKLVSFFMTFAGSDLQYKIKEQFRSLVDEYMTSELAKNAQELVPINTEVQFTVAKDQMKQINSIVSRVRDAMERSKERGKEEGSDVLLFGKELSSLANSTSADSDWGSGGNETWDFLRKGLKSLLPMFTSVSVAHVNQSQREEEEIVENLNLFLDLLSAYKDLCHRHDSEVVLGHQKAINRMKTKLAAGLMSTVEAEKQAEELEKRSHFSLHCIHMETQLVYCYMEIVAQVLKSLVALKSGGHQKLFELWEEMWPAVEGIFTSVMKRETRGSN